MKMAQWDLSRIFQRKIERKLAGFALIHPLQSLRAYRKVAKVMLDDMAIGWFRYLNLRENDLMAIDDERKIQLCYQLAFGWKDGIHLTELIGEMNWVYRDYDPCSIGKGELIWSHYSIEYICEDLASRIEEQCTFRSGLQDLTLFASSYLEGDYAR